MWKIMFYRSILGNQGLLEYKVEAFTQSTVDTNLSLALINDVFGITKAGLQAKEMIEHSNIKSEDKTFPFEVDIC